MPLAKCGGCGRFISAIEGAKCGKCMSPYHRACVGLPSKGNIIPNWRCPECKKNLVRDNKAETPVRAASYQADLHTDLDVAEQSDTSITHNSSADDSQELQHDASPMAGVVGKTPPAVDTRRPHAPVAAVRDTRRPLSPEAAVENTRQTVQHASSDMQSILHELKAVRAEMQMFRSQMQTELAELKVAMGTCNTRLVSLEARVEVLEQRANPSSSMPSNVEGIVEELRRELNDRDQDLLANDIEISNLPESSAESPIHLVRVIGQKLGVSVEERDIVSAERVGGRQIRATTSEGAMEHRPRALVVRLARRDLRDELMKSARVRRGATTADLGMTGPAKRFFLNERLTKTNRQLFRKTREAASIHNWRYVWTKRGRILVRNKPGDPTRRISSETDIMAIIGPAGDTS